MTKSIDPKKSSDYITKSEGFLEMANLALEHKKYDSAVMSAVHSAISALDALTTSCELPPNKLVWLLPASSSLKVAFADVCGCGSPIPWSGTVFTDSGVCSADSCRSSSI